MSHATTNMEGTENKIRVDFQKISEISPEQVCDYLGTTRSGLTEEMAQQRLLAHGDNSIKSKQSFHPLRRFVNQLINILAIMLWVASALALISGTPVLAYVIWFIIFINAFFSFFQESKADHALQDLSKMIPNNVKAYRDGILTVMSADKLVPGDVIELAAGDRVPADIRLIEAEGVFVDNSMLTGESVPVDREPEADPLSGKSLVNSRNLLFAGTSITEGKGTGVVYGTGKQTQIGNITQTTAHIVRRKSTLDAQIQKITRTLSIIAVALGVLAYLASALITGFSINAALIFAIGIIVANIPEGLMPTVSLSLALGVQRMSKKNALVRRQSAVETLSSTSVICTDKTGTLTQNAIFARQVWTPDGSVEISGNGYEKEGKVSGVTEINRPGLDRLFTASAVCSDTVLQTSKEDQTKWKMIGSPTEAAILVASYKYGKPSDQVKAQFTRKKVRPFSSNTKSMTVLAVNNQSTFFEKGHVIQFTKGDPTRVLAKCGYLYKQGKAMEITDADRAQVRTVNDQMAGKGFRVLAIACADRTGHPESEAQDLVLLGLVIMYDPPKKGVREAIRDCYKAGIKVTIVTGDYALTAAAIARQIGIVKDKYVAITGAELEKMSRQELAKKINTDLPVIFARTTPKDKLKIVETYQNLGHVVASTGDGINDVLALRKADIGIAMGENGSDAAIESSDVVLLDDNFTTIVEAIKEGRSIYENIRKFVTYILASNVPEVVPFMAMALFHLPLALTVLLVLAITLGTDMVPAISLGEELPDPDVLDYPPRNANENILNWRVLFRSYGYLGIVESVMLFFMFFLSWNSYGYSLNEIRGFTEPLAAGTVHGEILHVYQYAVTMALGAVIFCQIGNVLECRSPHLSMFRLLTKKNNLMWTGILIEIIFFLLIAHAPFLQYIFGTTAPQIGHLFLLLICPVVLIAAEELRKWFVKKRAQARRHEMAFH